MLRFAASESLLNCFSWAAQTQGLLNQTLQGPDILGQFSKTDAWWAVVPQLASDYPHQVEHSLCSLKLCRLSLDIYSLALALLCHAEHWDSCLLGQCWLLASTYSLTDIIVPPMLCFLKQTTCSCSSVYTCMRLQDWTAATRYNKARGRFVQVRTSWSGLPDHFFHVATVCTGSGCAPVGS